MKGQKLTSADFLVRIAGSPAGFFDGWLSGPSGDRSDCSQLWLRIAKGFYAGGHPL
jgi:hypothetical protein